MRTAQMLFLLFLGSLLPGVSLILAGGGDTDFCRIIDATPDLFRLMLFDQRRTDRLFELKNIEHQSLLNDMRRQTLFINLMPT